MKFPLVDRPFVTPIHLTGSQCSDLERVVHAVFQETMVEYQRFSERHARTLNTKEWKLVKAREDLSVYRERKARREMRHAYEWAIPELRAVGSVVGTLDEVMYGLLATTSEAMRIRSSYVEDDLLDSEVLTHCQGPTREDPFRFMGLKWFVHSPSSTAFHAMIAPRDVTVVEGMGIYTTPGSGERIGYQVLHSIDLSHCPELLNLGIVRSRIVACSLFKQLPNGTVDVFMTKHIGRVAHLPESVVLTAAANQLITCWKSVLCAQNKKLAWLAEDSQARWEQEGRGKERLILTIDAKGNYCCGLCIKPYRLYNSVITCQVCSLMVCSRCQISRDISRIQRNGDMLKLPFVYCKECMSKCLRAKAADVARHEFKLVEARPVHTAVKAEEYESGLLHRRQEVSKYLTSSRQDSMVTNSTIEGSLADMGSYDPVSLPLSDTPFPQEREDHLDEWELHPLDNSSPRSSASSYHSTTEQPEFYRYYPLPGTNSRKQLWAQMNQLCLAAEQTYNLTRQNAKQAQRAHSSRRFTEVEF